MTKKERQELIALARQARQEKLLKKLYEENKFLINNKSYVGFEEWRYRVIKNMNDNPKYKDLKEKGALLSAGKRQLRTKEYIDQDRIGEMYVREALIKTKTGRKIKWGKKEVFNKNTMRYEYEDKERDETMFDVLRKYLGHGKKAVKLNLFYSEETRSYHFIGADGKEYEIAIDKYNNVKEILKVNS